MIIKEENASSQALDHLGLVASVIKDVGLVAKIIAGRISDSGLPCCARNDGV